MFKMSEIVRDVKEDLKATVDGFDEQCLSDEDCEFLKCLAFKVLEKAYHCNERTHVISAVFETDDYGQFKVQKGNREVLDERFRKAEKAILKSSLGQLCPAIINENNEVCDGQARKKAVETLGLPFRFTFVPGARLEHTLCMNEPTTNWKLIDYISAHAGTNPACGELFRLIKQYGSSISKPTLIAMATGFYAGSTNGGAKRIILNDELDEERVFKISERINEFAKIAEALTDTKFARGCIHADKLRNAMAFMVFDNGYRVNRFVRGIRKIGNLKNVAPEGLGDFYKCLEVAIQIYNTGSAGRKRKMTAKELKAIYDESIKEL